MKKYRSIILTIMCILPLVGCSKKEKHEIEILVPADSTETFVYSEAEIRPVGNKITIWSGAGLGDTEVILKPVEVKQELLKNDPPAEPGDEGNDELSDIELVETITYNGKEYIKSELCDATLEWLELSEQKRMLSSYFPPEFMIFEETWGITLTLDNITPTGAIIKCTQSGGEPTGELQTGSWYILEVWTQEKGWQQMPYVIEGEIGWTSEAWMIPMNDICEWEVNWEWLYGKLPLGKYRIGKNIMDFRESGDYDTAIYFVEFEIVK